MKLTKLGLIASVSLVLVSCGEQGPSQRALAPRPHADVVAGSSCPDSSGIDAQVIALFSGGNQTAVLSRFANIAAILGATPPGTDTATAVQHTIDLIGFVLQKYQAGTLNGGTSAATQAQVVALVNGLLCYSGLAQVFTLGNLGNDGAFAILTGNTPDTTVTTGTQHAGVHVDSGSVSGTVLLTITRLPDSPGPLLTQLDQYPVFYEFDVSPKVPFTLPVLVGVCQSSSVTPPNPDRLRIAHNIAPDTMGSIEILPFAPATFLDCSNVASASTNPLANYAMAGWRAVESFFGPAALYAGTGGIGGTVKTFSPFGAVDTLLVMRHNSAPSQEFPVGDTVPQPPSVSVKTPAGHSYSGLPVAFAVTAGGGSLTGASTTTDAGGIATVGSWALGLTAGLNTVAATATNPYPGRLAIDTNPQVFSATALPPAKVAFTAQPSSIVAGTTMTPAVRVAIEDRNGNVVTSSSLPVSLALSPSGPTLFGTTTVNAVNGVATFSNLTVTKVGSYTLTATSGALTSATSTAFSVTNAAAAGIALVRGDNQSAAAGSAVAIAPAVRVSDQYGNPVAGVSVTFVPQNGGTVTGATQLTDASGTAAVGSWTLVAGTNYLLGETTNFFQGGTPLAGDPVTFTATGTTSTTALLACAPNNGSGDPLTRAFYDPKFPGRSLAQVDLWLSANVSANRPTPYTIQLIATSGGYNGAVIGTSTQTVYLRGNSSQNLPTHFVFAGAPAVQKNSTVAFRFNVLSNPDGAALRFNTGTCGVGDTNCRTSCPMIETADATGTLSVFYRKGTSVTILGGN